MLYADRIESEALGEDDEEMITDVLASLRVCMCVCRGRVIDR